MDPQTKKMTEKTIGSELLYDGHLVKLYIDTVQLPDGRQGAREIIRHPGAVAMVPLRPTNAAGTGSPSNDPPSAAQDGYTVLLVQQYRAAAGRVLLEVPAGTLEPGEDPALAAARELQEEIGYRPGKLERLGAEYTAPGYTSEKIHLYLATELEAAALDPDGDEFIEVVELPLAEAVRQVEDGTIEDGKTIAALLWVARRRGV